MSGIAYMAHRWLARSQYALGLFHRWQARQSSGSTDDRLVEQVLQAAQQICGARSQAAVVGLVTSQIRARLGSVWVEVVTPEDGGLQRLSTGFPDPLQVNLDQLAKSQEETHWTWVRQHGCALVLDDAAAWRLIPAVGERYQQAGIASLISLPLSAAQRTAGMLTVYSRKRLSVQKADLAFLAAIAGQAQLALQGAELHQEAERERMRTARSAQLLQEAAATLAAREMGTSSSVNLIAQVAARLFAPATVLLHIGDETRWYEEGGSPETPCLAGGPYALCLPVTLGKKQWGHLEVYFHGEEPRSNPDELATLQALVHLTGFALGGISMAEETRRALSQVEQAYMGALEALSKALELRDHETDGHCRRVVQYTSMLAKFLGVPDDQMPALVRGALLHDIGKIGIPDAILRKPGPLNTEEWAVMKEHPRIGFQLLRQIDFLQDAMPIILHHHERYDGSGYPDGLRAEVIPLGARIFAVADAYDAITSDRPYRKGRSHQEAMEEIARCAGSHFDASVVEALIQLDPDEFAAIRTGKLLSLR